MTPGFGGLGKEIPGKGAIKKRKREWSLRKKKKNYRKNTFSLLRCTKAIGETKVVPESGDNDASSKFRQKNLTLKPERGLSFFFGARSQKGAFLPNWGTLLGQVTGCANGTRAIPSHAKDESDNFFPKIRRAGRPSTSRIDTVDKCYLYFYSLSNMALLLPHVRDTHRRFRIFFALSLTWQLQRCSGNDSNSNNSSFPSCF